MLSESKLYNAWTKWWYQKLKHPVKLKVVYDVKRVKQPRLTLVFLHGTAATSETWQTTFRQFADDPALKEVRMIALDLLGFGRSLQADWLEYDYLDYEIAIDNTLRALKVDTPVVLIGHSMGSLIAADYATNYQSAMKVVRMILVSPPVLLPEELARLPDKVYTKSFSALHHLAKTEPVVGVIAEIIQRFSNFNRKYLQTPGFARSMEQVILAPSNVQTFRKIPVPTVIIHGRFDPLVVGANLKTVADMNDNVRLVTVTAQHDVSALKRRKMLAAVKEVLADETL